MLGKTLLLVVAALPFAGCKLDLPAVESATFEFHSMATGRDQVTTGDLSSSQVKGLSAWLEAHQEGWKFRIEDTAPGLLVHFKNKGVAVAVVNLRVTEIKVKDLFRGLTKTEHDALLALVIPQNR